jgi:hypothetical protein
MMDRLGMAKLAARDGGAKGDEIMMTVRTAATAALLGLVLAAGAAQASVQQDGKGDRADQLLSNALQPRTTPVQAAVNDGEAYHRAPDSEQNPAEVRTTQALNDEIASRNALAENQERADQAAFEAERARHEQVVAQAMQDQLAYEEGVRQAEAARRQWEADRARWEADVRACQAGDLSRCAPPRY